MKKRNKGWHGVWVAGMLLLTALPYAYGQGTGSDATANKSGTPAGSPSATTDRTQPDPTESQSMPTDVSDLRGKTTPNKESSEMPRSQGGRRAAPQPIMPPQSHPSPTTTPLPQTPE